MAMMMCGSVCLASFQQGYYTTGRGSSWSSISASPRKTTGIFLGHNGGSNISDSKKKNTGNSQQLQEKDPHNKRQSPVLPPLDVVLARARKRPVSPMLRFQTFLNAPVLKKKCSWLTPSDVAFSILAIYIGSKGFALGLVLGKWTASASDGINNPILSRTKQRLPKEIVQVYPVLLAILMDQLL